MRELQSLHEELNSEYKQLKEEVINLQQQLTDLKFQLSSKDMEHQAAVQVNSSVTFFLPDDKCQYFKP